jgi:hypothetical protein
LGGGGPVRGCSASNIRSRAAICSLSVDGRCGAN